MRLKLRELRVLLREALDGEHVSLSAEDFIPGIMAPKTSVMRNRDINVFIPFKLQAKPRSSKLIELVSSGLTMSDLLKTLKVNEVTGTNVRVTTTDDVREQVFSTMARQIASHFEGESIDLVTAPESSAPMAEVLASKVAETLGVPFESSILRKVKSPTSFSYDETRVARWAEDQHKTPEDVAKLKSLLDKESAAMRKKMSKGDTVSTKGIPHQHRRFYNLMTLTHSHELAGKTILVIDDNIDRGWTLQGINDLITEQGGKPLFAVGVDMTWLPVKK